MGNSDFGSLLLKKETVTKFSKLVFSSTKRMSTQELGSCFAVCLRNLSFLSRGDEQVALGCYAPKSLNFTPSHIWTFKTRGSKSPVVRGQMGHKEEKQHLRKITTLCHPKPQGGKMLLQAAAVNDNMPKNFLGPLQASSHAVWKSDRGYIFTPSCYFMT